MARKKVKLAIIAKLSSRRSTYNKRKKGLLKKVHEISTLCGINAGAIIYSSFDPNPAVWPSVNGMRQVINRFRDVPKIERDKNKFTQETFLKERITKVRTNVEKQRKENIETYLTEVMYQCLLENMGTSDIPPSKLNGLGFVIGQFLTAVDRRIEVLGGSDMEMGEPSNAVEATHPSEPVGTLTRVDGPTAPPTFVHGVGSSSSSAAPAGASLFDPMPHFTQFYQPPAQYYDQSGNQNQFMGMMNHQAYYNHHQPQQHQFFPGESSNAPPQLIFFGGESSNAPPHQFFPGESSTAQPPATSGSDTPATTPNPTNNIWFNN